MDNNTQSGLALYKYNFGLVSPDDIGSIRFQFCSDSPLVDEPCQVPAGFSGSGASLFSQSGVSGFTKLPTVDDNVITISRTAAAVTPGPVSFSFKDVVNPSAIGTYYVRIQTYASQDASGPDIDFGGLSYVINDKISIHAQVPPYLLLCSGVTIAGYDCATASGSYINFGELSSVSTKSAKSELVLATNAQNGYRLYVTGLTMASGTDIIPAQTTNDVSRPGLSQFGINLAANTTPQVGSGASGPGIGIVDSGYQVSDRFHYISGDEIASALNASDYNKYTVSYIINIDKNQSAGVYISTLTYVAAANF
jgi:hypothetical protein